LCQCVDVPAEYFKNEVERNVTKTLLTTKEKPSPRSPPVTFTQHALKSGSYGILRPVFALVTPFEECVFARLIEFLPGAKSLSRSKQEL
jgi:hypothetical protein